MSEDGVALADQGFGQELPEVTEANDSDFEVLAALEMDDRQLRFVVERLGGVESLQAEGSAAPKREGGSGGFGK